MVRIGAGVLPGRCCPVPELVELVARARSPRGRFTLPTDRQVAALPAAVDARRQILLGGLGNRLS